VRSLKLDTLNTDVHSAGYSDNVDRRDNQVVGPLQDPDLGSKREEKCGRCAAQYSTYDGADQWHIEPASRCFG
jgi:hypothetical protein